jgi:hypothetical protein
MLAACLKNDTIQDVYQVQHTLKTIFTALFSAVKAQPDTEWFDRHVCCLAAFVFSVLSTLNISEIFEGWVIDTWIRYAERVPLEETVKWDWTDRPMIKRDTPVPSNPTSNRMELERVKQDCMTAWSNIEKMNYASLERCWTDIIAAVRQLQSLS